MDSLAWLYSRAARSHARLIARLFVLDRSATATATSKPASGGETWHASTLRAEESDLWSLLAERLPATWAQKAGPCVHDADAQVRRLAVEVPARTRPS